MRRETKVMMNEQIICIYCGKKAEILESDNSIVIACGCCGSESEGEKYQLMFEKWIGLEWKEEREIN